LWNIVGPLRDLVKAAFSYIEAKIWMPVEQGYRGAGMEQWRNEDHSGWHNGKTVLESGGQRRQKY